MTTPEDRDALLRAAEHVEQTRQRLEQGKREIDRQRAAVADTHRHLVGLSRWIEQTERHLGEQRSRREEPEAEDDLPPAA